MQPDVCVLCADCLLSCNDTIVCAESSRTTWFGVALCGEHAVAMLYTAAESLQRGAGWFHLACNIAGNCAEAHA